MLGKKRVSLFGIALMVLAAVCSADSGFTPIVPSPDSRLIYVSSSEGKDSNNCLSEATPCKTLVAGLGKMRLGYPDHLYLKRGDHWRDEVFAKIDKYASGRSAVEPAVISYYGKSGDRPRIESGPNIIHAYTVKNFSVIGLEFYNYPKVVGEPGFTGDGKGNVFFLGPVENILMEDNVFRHVEFVAQDWETGRPANIVLRRNIWTGAYHNKSSYSRDVRPSNLYIQGVDGVLIEENVIDYGGWNPDVPGAGANMFNHNVYMQGGMDGSKIIFRRNIVTRASSHGIQLRSCGVAEDNFFARNAVALSIGYESQPPISTANCHVLANVISEADSMIKGVDPCRGVNLCTGASWGIDVQSAGGAEWRIANNVVSLQSPDDTKHLDYKIGTPETGLKSVSLIRYSYHLKTINPIVQSNNIAYKFASDKESADVKYVDPMRTAATYNKSLGGVESFNAFMDKVLSRGLGEWDGRYTAEAINSYVRKGFVVADGPLSSSSGSSGSSSSSASSSSSGSASSASSSSGDPIVVKMTGKLTCTVEAGEVTSH